MLGIKILEETNSKYNGHLCVCKSWGFGTYIQANGLTQSGGIVESIWKNTLRKVKGKGQEVDNCLILGLGGGTVAKLVKKNCPDAKITGVDIDPIMVDLGKKYLGLDKTKVDIHVQDAFKFAKGYSLLSIRYDLVIVDLYNGDKFPKKFETENYIQLVRSLLASGGTAIFNRLYYKDKKFSAIKFGNKLKKIFPDVSSFRPQANLMLICRH